MSLQGVTPEQDVLSDTINYIHDNDELQILINEIRDLKTKIEAIEKILVIVIPLEIPVKSKK